MRRLRALPLALLGMVPPSSLLAQDLPGCPPPDSLAGLGAVVGQVVDAQTQVPLGFVQLRPRVQGEEEAREARSSARGQFQFCSLPAGFFTLSGQLLQFGCAVGPVPLEGGQTLSLALYLSAAPAGRSTGTLAGEVVDAGGGSH